MNFPDSYPVNCQSELDGAQSDTFIPVSHRPHWIRPNFQLQDAYYTGDAERGALMRVRVRETAAT